ncbi:hypothetical protein [Aneurinibacillus terranovensis]|uniref:hypothetical protein n=1 Tax=Aneurinibacillus terranovensis TaxID=278991 RepID=UPI000482195B
MAGPLNRFHGILFLTRAAPPFSSIPDEPGKQFWYQVFNDKALMNRALFQWFRRFNRFGWFVLSLYFPIGSRFNLILPFLQDCIRLLPNRFPVCISRAFLAVP